MPLIKYAKVIWEDFVSLVYPEICIHCGDNLVKNELYICTSCRTSLPVTEYHKDQNNPVMQQFAYLPKVVFAASYLQFHKRGIAQDILHELKYKGEQKLGEIVGRWYGSHLKALNISASVIIPIPIHKSKLKLRGFNQSTKIAVGISEIIGIPVNDKLVERIKSTSTQTKKTKVERWENVDAVYRILSTKLLENKEVIIVDDVITTGATIGALCELIQPFVSKIYILSIATGK